jgi:hypothetical protein
LEKKAKEEGKGVPLDDSDEEAKINPATISREVKVYKDLISKLQGEIKRRDNEIAILVQHVNKLKGTSSGVPVTQAEEGDDLDSNNKMSFYQMMMNKKEESKELSEDTYTTGMTKPTANWSSTTKKVEELLKKDKNLICEVKLDQEDLIDKTKAFDKFRKSYRKNEAMEDNKEILKDKIAKGKVTGVRAKELKEEMKHITAKIEEIRREKAMRGLVDDEGNIMKSDEEDELQSKLQEMKTEYTEKYHKLKTLKAEIETLQGIIEKAWKQLQKDFEDWYKMYDKKDLKSTMGMTKDKQVQEDLKAFYQARDKIHNNS